MAYDVDKRPATWVWEQTVKRRNGIIAVVIIALLLIALDIAYLIPRFNLAVAIIVSVLAVPILAIRSIRNLPDRMMIPYENWRAGAKAEQAIGELLNQLRSELFTVMHDIEQAGEGNIDHLVSGPAGVFMIESKAKGYRQEALLKAKRQAAKIHDELDNHWVVPVICIHKRDKRPFNHDGVWIVPEQHLLDWIRSQKNQTVPFERLARYADTVS
jgi:hypothetical protein